MGVFKITVTVCVCMLAARFAHATKTTADYLEPPTIVDLSDDAELLAAHKRAKATVGQFISRLQARSSSDTDFAVQIVVRDGDLQEYLWLTDVRFERGRLSGKVDARPRLVNTVKIGERLRTAPSEISDWMIVEHTLTGERMVGGYTVKVLQARERRGLVPDYLAYDPAYL